MQGVFLNFFMAFQFTVVSAMRPVIFIPDYNTTCGSIIGKGSNFGVDDRYLCFTIRTPKRSLATFETRVNNICVKIKEHFNSKKKLQSLPDVYLIGISHGGLVARFLMMNCEGLKEKVKGLVTIGTPNLGMDDIPKHFKDKPESVRFNYERIFNEAAQETDGSPTTLDPFEYITIRGAVPDKNVGYKLKYEKCEPESTSGVSGKGYFNSAAPKKLIASTNEHVNDRSLDLKRPHTGHINSYNQNGKKPVAFEKYEKVDSNEHEDSSLKSHGSQDTVNRDIDLKFVGNKKKISRFEPDVSDISAQPLNTSFTEKEEIFDYINELEVPNYGITERSKKNKSRYGEEKTGKINNEIYRKIFGTTGTTIDGRNSYKKSVRSIDDHTSNNDPITPRHNKMLPSKPIIATGSNIPVRRIHRSKKNYAVSERTILKSSNRLVQATNNITPYNDFCTVVEQGDKR